MSADDELAIRALVARYADAGCRGTRDAEPVANSDCEYDWVGQVVTSGLVEVAGDRARGWWYIIEFNNRAQGDGTLHHPARGPRHR